MLGWPHWICQVPLITRGKYWSQDNRAKLQSFPLSYQGKNALHFSDLRDTASWKQNQHIYCRFAKILSSGTFMLLVWNAGQPFWRISWKSRIIIQQSATVVFMSYQNMHGLFAWYISHFDNFTKKNLDNIESTACSTIVCSTILLSIF